LALLDRLELPMGMIDLKLTDDGEPVFLEVNPQGQFLFLQPLTEQPLLAAFADYLSASPSEG
jgi:D-alanine-D-alanine ligase-like ATP-grasp enzyme